MFSVIWAGLARFLAPVMLPLMVGIAAFLCGDWYGTESAAKDCKLRQAEAQAEAYDHEITKARRQLARSADIGDARERDRAAIDDVFDRLSRKAMHEPEASSPSCVLPDGRLRLWAAANAGADDPGAATAELDGTAAALAAAGLGAPGGPGGESPPGSPALPPAREPDVPPTGVPGDPP